MYQQGYRKTGIWDRPEYAGIYRYLVGNFHSMNDRSRCNKLKHQQYGFYRHFVIGYLLILILFSQLLHAQTVVSTYAGTGLSGYADGDTATCRFKSPDGICIDPAGNLFIADGDNHCIRKISQDGQVTTYAGTGVAGYADGPDSVAQFRTPFDLCSDAMGNLYVSDFENQYIRKITPEGMVSTVAGSGIAGYVDGPAMIAEFNYPRGIVTDQSGNLYVSDSWNHRVRKIDVNGAVSTYAGGGNIFGVQSVSEFKDGSDTSARFYTPCGLSIDAAGNIYVADAYNHRVRKIDPSRQVTTVAGSGSSGATGGGFLDGDTATARFNTLTELHVSMSGAIYVSDTYNNRMRLIQDGMVSTLAGSGVAGYLDGIDSVAKFNHPRGVIPDEPGNSLLVCDGNNRRIRRVTFEMTTGMAPDPAPAAQLIYPNPSSGHFNVAALSSNSILHIAEVTGRILLEEALWAGKVCSFDIGHFSQGIYLATVIGEDGVVHAFRIYKSE